MTALVAFLRGVNVGRRLIKAKDLAQAFQDLGLAQVQTILATGNVRFCADPAPDLADRIAAGLEARFGFPVGTILRPVPALQAMLAADPFAGIDPAADVKRYVMLLDRPLAEPPHPLRVPGDFEVLRIDPTALYILAHRLPNGRYGQGIDQLARQVDKAVLATTRNWTTIIKAAR